MVVSSRLSRSSAVLGAKNELEKDNVFRIGKHKISRRSTSRIALLQGVQASLGGDRKRNTRGHASSCRVLLSESSISSLSLPSFNSRPLLSLIHPTVTLVTLWSGSSDLWFFNRSIAHVYSFCSYTVSARPVPLCLIPLAPVYDSPP